MAEGKKIASECIQGVNDNMVQSHYHDYFELYFLEQGKRYHMVNDSLYCLHSGEFIIFPPYVMHHSYGDTDEPFKRLLIYFSPETVLIPDIIPMLNDSAKVYRPKANDSILFFLKEVLKEQNEQKLYSEDAMQMLLNQLLIKTVRHVSETLVPEIKNRITDIIHYLHQNFAETISLEDLAAKFYISPYYLCREFKRYTNSTIIQYINHLRIISAQRMFMETDKNITDISVAVGFSNVTHFDRVFKSITGMSPSKNRKQYLDKKNQQ
jgi:AraC-like DNA-binding protein